MKLAEALMERSDLNKKIFQLRSRILNNTLVQEGEEPVENPVELMDEIDIAVQRLEYLMARINATNCKTVVAGMTITDIIAAKDAKTLKIEVYRSILMEGGQSTSRARGTEIKIKPTIDIVELQKKMDVLSKELRELDNLLQMSNWQVDLIE